MSHVEFHIGHTHTEHVYGQGCTLSDDVWPWIIVDSSAEDQQININIFFIALSFSAWTLIYFFYFSKVVVFFVCAKC